jgi:hypothetical protein
MGIQGFYDPTTDLQVFDVDSTRIILGAKVGCLLLVAYRLSKGSRCSVATSQLWRIQNRTPTIVDLREANYPANPTCGTSRPGTLQVQRGFPAGTVLFCTCEARKGKECMPPFECMPPAAAAPAFWPLVASSGPGPPRHFPESRGHPLVYKFIHSSYCLLSGKWSRLCPCFLAVSPPRKSQDSNFISLPNTTGHRKEEVSYAYHVLRHFKFLVNGRLQTCGGHVKS